MMKNGLYVDRDGIKQWYRHGKLHRKRGPAEESPHGDKRWYLNGVLHRKDGPAVENASGLKCWFVNGMRHREDGPAIENPNNSDSWYLNDVFLGYNAKGFWRLWDRLTPEQQNDLNLHLWMAKYT